MMSPRWSLLLISLLAIALVVPGSAPLRAEDVAKSSDYQSTVRPFFQSYCIDCHGPQTSEADLTLHELDANAFALEQLDAWEQILERLRSGEMPPEDAEQPTRAERVAATAWIEGRLRAAIQEAGPSSVDPVARRLTNFEYENTMRDLLGFRLDLIEDLPKDPSKPYRFNNSADMMRMGPERFDRYLECARRAMASAIVDPGEPELHQSRREWLPHGVDRGLGGDEISPWGNRRNTPAWGMGLKSFPKTGEYRIRMQASAILPPGIKELPLRLVMGYSLGENSATLRVATVGTVRLRNTPDAPQVFEFRGRIENHPPRPSRVVRGKRRPPTMTITPQNLYDDGTLNDGRRDLAMPRTVINWIEFEAPLKTTWPPEHHTRILFPSPLRESNPHAYTRAVLRRFISRAYRRPATTEEVERFATIYGLLRPEMETLEAAMRETLSLVLVSPQFLHHTVADEATSPQYALASRLSYFLWGSMPDEELLQLAGEQRLDDDSVIEQQVRRLLADERSRDFVRNFTEQWLSLAKLKTVPINRELFPRFLYYVSAGERAGTEVPYRPTIRDYMVEETVGFIGELIRRDASVLNIVDSDFAFLNQPLAAHYGVEGVQGDQLRAVPIQPKHRLGGLLTQGSVLIANGTGSAPHPIYRAVWLREAILGDEVPPPPADVPALSDSAGESADAALTIKDLLAKHRQKESCNRCHARLDPWGIPFERYNAIGKFQHWTPKEGTRVRGFSKNDHKDLEGYQAYLKSINTIKVDANARIPQGPEVDGMAELKQHLLDARSDDVAENMIRRLLTYGLGRELTVRDRFIVEQLLQRSKNQEYRLQQMIVTVCRSELFRNR